MLEPVPQRLDEPRPLDASLARMVARACSLPVACSGHIPVQFLPATPASKIGHGSSWAFTAATSPARNLDATGFRKSPQGSASVRSTLGFRALSVIATFT